MERLEAEIDPSYERVIAKCKRCGHRNIFSRVDDLKTYEPVGGMEISCLNPDCGFPLWITGDIVNCAYEMLLIDCSDLMKQKHYIYCILNISQAYEMFFSQYIRYTLLYVPYANDRNLARFRELYGRLGTKLGDFTFAGLRNTFLKWAATGLSIRSYSLAERQIDVLSPKEDTPSDSLIEGCSRPELANLLAAVKCVKVHEIRNDVVHHAGYRPRRIQVESCLSEAWTLFSGLCDALRIRRDNLDWYDASNSSLA